MPWTSCRSICCPPIAHGAGVEHLRKVVPTTDLNVTFGMALTACSFSSNLLQHQGQGPRRLHRRTGSLQPFQRQESLRQGAAGSRQPASSEIVPLLARPISLSLRLYGNLFAGEMIFLLLATLSLHGIQQLGSVSGWLFVVMQFLLAFAWAVFHLLDDYPASLHIHGVDDRLSGDGTGTPLDVASPAVAPLSHLFRIGDIEWKILHTSKP